MCIVLAPFLSCPALARRSVCYYLYKRKNIAVWPLLMRSPFAFRLVEWRCLQSDRPVCNSAPRANLNVIISQLKSGENKGNNVPLWSQYELERN